MYKNPELSTMAKILAREMKAQGVHLKHAQALEMVAKMHGARNLHVAQAAGAKAESASPMLFKGEVFDNRLHDGVAEADVPEAHRQPYTVSVEHRGGNIMLKLSPAGVAVDAPEADQLQLFVNVDNGKPSVCLGNALDADMLLKVTACTGGLYFSPMMHGTPLCTGIPSNPALAEVQALERETSDYLSTMHHAFMQNPPQ